MESAMTAVASAISAQFSTANIASVFVAALAIALPLIACWFGIRFVYRRAKSAFKRGN